MWNELICHYKGHKFTNFIMNIDSGRALYQCKRCKFVDSGINISAVPKDYIEKEHRFVYRP